MKSERPRRKSLKVVLWLLATYFVIIFGAYLMTTGEAPYLPGTIVGGAVAVTPPANWNCTASAFNPSDPVELRAPIFTLEPNGAKEGIVLYDAKWKANVSGPSGAKRLVDHWRKSWLRKKEEVSDLVVEYGEPTIVYVVIPNPSLKEAGTLKIGLVALSTGPMYEFESSELKEHSLVAPVLKRILASVREAKGKYVVSSGAEVVGREIAVHLPLEYFGSWTTSEARGKDNDHPYEHLYFQSDDGKAALAVDDHILYFSESSEDFEKLVTRWRSMLKAKVDVGPMTTRKVGRETLYGFSYSLPGKGAVRTMAALTMGPDEAVRVVITVEPGGHMNDQAIDKILESVRTVAR